MSGVRALSCRYSFEVGEWVVANDFALLLFEKKNLKAKLIQMIIELQKLKTWSEAEKQKAKEEMIFYKECNLEYSEGIEAGRFKAFCEMFDRLNLLLNSENEKQQ